MLNFMIKSTDKRKRNSVDCKQLQIDKELYIEEVYEITCGTVYYLLIHLK